MALLMLSPAPKQQNNVLAMAELPLVSLVALVFLLHSASGQCPLVCSCIGRTSTMDCTPNPAVTGTDFKFTSIPQNGPSSTRVIIMTGNSLSSLDPGSFETYPSLEALVLNDNLFTRVPSGGFFNLTITNLTFDGNPLAEIDQAAFSNLTSLQHLSVQRTPTLGTINGSEAFADLNRLISLNLDNNLLQELPVDFLTSVPQLQTLSLRNNSLQTLPDGILSPVTLSQIQLDLSLNPWSCDCFLRWLRLFLDTATNLLISDMQTVCHWPPAHNSPTRTPLSLVPSTGYRCYEPTITRNATNSTLFSNITLTIPCGLDAAPFPEVVWRKDGDPLNLTERVHISRYDAALQFESQGVDDSGEYQCFLTNGNGTAESSTVTIVILEHTCFDTVLSRSHETDIDCGGTFCRPCNISQGCLLDRDCEGDLVCLYSHLLPSFLHYISPFHRDAYTCADPSQPEVLLEAILQNGLPLDINIANISGGNVAATLHSAMHDFLAQQLQVSRSTIANVRISSVEKTIRPLIQVWFDLPKTPLGEQAGMQVSQLVNSGSLRATVRIKEDTNFMNYRLNL